MPIKPTLFFYDLETSGIDPRRQRIMQFAGVRTDEDLNIIGEPIDIKVALADDTLPDPYAVFVTGITPQQTLEEGYNEAEFLKIFYEQVCVPGTAIVGFNNVRFDDEFMRFTLWRNFCDAYEWQWKDGCPRWDLLDVVRMTRALRPEGINWPVTPEGAPTNRLELLSRENKLNHAKAHDALSDVYALIDVAKLIRDKQPKLYSYLYNCRSKRDVERLAAPASGQPFIYTSGRYPKETLHTTAVLSLSEGSQPGRAVVYDLRHDPSEWAGKTADELKKIRFASRELRASDDFKPLPAKEIAYNRCPAVAPLGTLDAAAQERLGLTLETIEKHRKILLGTNLAATLAEVFALTGESNNNEDVDGALYGGGFVGDADKAKMRALRAATTDDLKRFSADFNDERLNKLLLRYKARNYPASLSSAERESWEEYRAARLAAMAPGFAKQLQELAAKNPTDNQQFLLQELQLWYENVMPSEA